MICTGNICRSPMAEALLLAKLRERGKSTRVESAGIRALVGAPADETAVELMRLRNLDISGHRGRQLTAALMSEFALVLVMSEEQKALLEQKYPTSRGRVHRLGRTHKVDVPDPYKRGRAAFERALELIDRGLEDMGQLLFGGSAKPTPGPHQ